VSRSFLLSQILLLGVLDGDCALNEELSRRYLFLFLLLLLLLLLPPLPFSHSYSTVGRLMQRGQMGLDRGGFVFVAADEGDMRGCLWTLGA